MLKFLAPLILFVLFAPVVFASSATAYKDYLYQFDVYRTKYADFKVAKNEYLKFKTLTSQTTALGNTKAMMAQRDELLRAYLLLLNEKLNENAGISETERNTYQTYIRNEVAFLEGHSKLVESIGSLEDATQTSRDLESHYAILSSSMRQTISGISLGDLSVLAKSFDIALADAKALVTTNRGIFPPEKQATLDRWLLQIANVRSLYQQKVDIMRGYEQELRGTNIEEQNQRFAAIKRGVGEARQYLLDGSGYLGELTTALRYQN
jgi:hypothetical protein